MNNMITPMDLYYEDTDVLKLQEIWSQYPELIGKPEIWKPITKRLVPTVIEGRYFISTYGRAYSIKSNKFLTPVATDNGYFRVSLIEEGKLGGRYHLLHRLVLKAFYPIPNSEQFQVNHKDGIKSHNWYWNLEWATCYENIHHAMDTGLRTQFGETHYNCSITEETADKIGFLLCNSNMTAKEIASSLGTTEKVVFNIMNGISWRHVYEKYQLFNINRNPKVLDINSIHRICQLFEELSRKNITPKFGKRIEFFKQILMEAGIDITDSTLRLAERLYYKLTHLDICNLYNY